MEGRPTVLVISRRISETLKIGDNITITVLRIKGGQVRLGIAAPLDVAIHREDALYRFKTEESALEHEEK